MLRVFAFVVFCLCYSCKVNSNDDPIDPSKFPLEDQKEILYKPIPISTNKAIYHPSDDVEFTLQNASLPSIAKIRYKHLDKLVAEEGFQGLTWVWKAPKEDFKGYTVEVYAVEEDIETIYATIAVDVSSSWTKFPRYGFLSSYPKDAAVEQVISNLNRHHINGIQFYDWHNKHHLPFPGEKEKPPSQWKDILNRDIDLNTMRKYIQSSHQFNMKTMYYNLIFGAWNRAEKDGVRKEWYVYKDNTHTNYDFHALPSPPFLSDIFLLDPANPEWQEYYLFQNEKVYAGLSFDGFHMDQLGDRGMRYRYDGSPLNLAQTYASFINVIKEEVPAKYAVMNAVNQYGQQGIAETPVDFLYSEVWSPFDKYEDLSNVIKQNNLLSNQTKNTVLAAYVNYDLSNRSGYFNTPSVLLANAVIFAFGGVHLELGEHLLANEYFPNNNLKMDEDLKKALISYYDFITAYQNILRDGGTFNAVNLSAVHADVRFSNWPSALGSISVVGKKVGTSQVIHLLNFSNAKTLEWRDNKGIQPIPIQFKDIELQFMSEEKVKNIWTSSPDELGSASRSLNFRQSNDKVNLVLPRLAYWTMIVVEY